MKRKHDPLFHRCDFRSPLELINYIQQEKIKLPVNVKCGNSTFTLTEENFNDVRLGCLMASSWGEES